MRYKGSPHVNRDRRRYDELIAILQHEEFWPYKRWAVKALAALERCDEAIALAESAAGGSSCQPDRDALCESILIEAGRAEEAYERYGRAAHRTSTYLATFRAAVERYPGRSPAAILRDLVRSTPGEEGKWFAAAKDAGFYDAALAFAEVSPCDPRTLTRAARDHVESNPAFAVGAGCLALHWLVRGHGYEVTGLDVHAAFGAAMKAAAKLGQAAETRQRIRAMVAADRASWSLVRSTLSRELGL